MLGQSSGNHDWLLATQALAFLAVFVYTTNATQPIAFEWKPGFSYCESKNTHLFDRSLVNHGQILIFR